MTNAQTKKTTPKTVDANNHSDHTHAHNDHAHTHDNHPHDNTTPSPIGENLKFTISIPWKTVQVEYVKALQAIAAEVELKGFRKGKAPINLVEEKVGKTKIYEETASRVLGPAYSEEVQKKGYKPVVEPQVHPKSLEENKEWVFEIETAEIPMVTLGDYQGAVRGAKAKDAIWTPGKDEKKPEEQSEETKLKLIFQALLETSIVQVPELLVRAEVHRALSRLVGQLDRLHIPLDDYLKSVNKTSDELRQEYAVSSLTQLQLEFILGEIARQEKIDISEKDIDGMIAAIPDEQIRKTAQTPSERLYIKSTLLRRKTIERLLAL